MRCRDQVSAKFDDHYDTSHSYDQILCQKRCYFVTSSETPDLGMTYTHLKQLSLAVIVLEHRLAGGSLEHDSGQLHGKVEESRSGLGLGQVAAKRGGQTGPGQEIPIDVTTGDMGPGGYT